LLHCLILFKDTRQPPELVHKNLVVGKANLTQSFNEVPELLLSLLRLDQFQKGFPADSFLTIA